MKPFYPHKLTSNFIIFLLSETTDKMRLREWQFSRTRLLRQNFTSYLWHFSQKLRSRNIPHSYLAWSEAILQSAEISIPKNSGKRPRRHSLPWWNAECSAKVQERRASFAAYKNNPSQDTYLNLKGVQAECRFCEIGWWSPWHGRHSSSRLSWNPWRILKRRSPTAL